MNEPNDTLTPDDDAAQDAPDPSTPESAANAGSPQGADSSEEPASSSESDSTAASAVDAGTPAGAGTPPPGPNEAEVREQLGLSGSDGTVLDSSEVERLLSGALDGYGEILSQVDSLAAQDAAENAPTSKIPPMGAELVDQNLELLRDVHLNVKVELGRGRMYLKDILRLGQGSVVELERLAGDPLDIYVNDKVIARGEVLVLNESFCIRITEVFNPEDLRQAMA